jgi:hypothetical protein
MTSSAEARRKQAPTVTARILIVTSSAFTEAARRLDRPGFTGIRRAVEDCLGYS